VIIDKYGCDALRFTLANMSTPGRDIKLASSRIEGNRNFATKLWNAARYCEMNECKWDAGFDPAEVKHTVNKWIIGETKLAIDKIAAHLDEYRFDLASSAAYDFVWNNFCDWYLEFTKPILTEFGPPEHEEIKKETRAATAWALSQILCFLHPIMPYITEELWAQFIGQGMLMKTAWPKLNDNLLNAGREDINWVIDIITKIRAARTEYNIPPAARINVYTAWTPAQSEKFSPYVPMFSKEVRLANSYSLFTKEDVEKFKSEHTGKYIQIICDNVTFYIPLADVIDLDQECARLGKESDKWSAEIKKIENKLANKDFVDRAPPEVVEEHRERKAEAEAMLAKLQAAQKSLAI